ncbi:hypothetical protein I312_100465 [Cryptococcus bacillisporus CA1280]|uniref:NAD-dependent epimerase/dehydratase domain-containing protein n=2 Tax=Cryptococcus gattii TaxID=552467 RepID=A0A0D0VX35_CRYGA|nr:hypothetical protein I312_01049 [Cryptococcus bacillisporus CA1280]KIR68452.1 hypothetical protein I314_00871 [Cryptococcus bacillisporus CA1873]|eukprot:KIR68452.1 hypothetical protein I314_00871 [Cryptococcus gattii CA1873]
MKVIVLGASGFIGYPVARAFVQAGHFVWGQTRSESIAASTLSPNEILPIVCDPHSPEGQKKWGELAKDADIVVDCIAASGPDNALAAFNTFLSAVKDRPKWGPKPTYIYTAGHWVFSRGAGGLDKWTDERRPALAALNSPTIWRTKVMEPVLSNENVNGIVVAPTCLYGRSGSYFAYYHFDAALAAVEKGEKEFETIMRDDSRLLTIHQDDLADLYVRVGERSPACKGQVFLAANPSPESLKEILDSVVRVTGLKGYKAKEATDPYEKFWVSTLLARPSLGTALTGWRPKRLPLTDGMDIYWHSYVASKKRTA